MSEPIGTWRRWLEDRASYVFTNYWGSRFYLTLGLLWDEISQAQLDAWESRLNTTTHDPAFDSLSSIGAEQSTPQYPSETWESYRARLVDPWGTWGRAGSARLIVEQLRAAGASVDPVIPRQDAVLLYLDADNAGAAFLSGDYVTVPNGGTLGGNITSASGTGPAVTAINGRNAALTTTQGGFAFGSTSSLQLLHEPGTNATLVARLRVDSVAPSLGWVFTTRGGAATSRGLNLVQEANGRFYLSVSDGATNTVSISQPVAFAVGIHTVVVRKTGSLYEIICDGSVVASATASALTSGASASSPQIGGRLGDLNPFTGAVCEVMVFSEALSDAELATIDAYYEGRWVLPDGFLPYVTRVGISEFTVTFPAGTHPITGAGQLWGAWTWGTGFWGPIGAPDGWLQSWIALVNHWKPANWVCTELIFDLGGGNFARAGARA